MDGAGRVALLASGVRVRLIGVRVRLRCGLAAGRLWRPLRVASNGKAEKNDCLQVRLVHESVSCNVLASGLIELDGKGSIGRARARVVTYLGDR